MCLSYLPVKGASVPCLRTTRNCSWVCVSEDVLGG